MQKHRGLFLICIIFFFYTPCFADTSTILMDKKEVIVPNYEGFLLISDRNSSTFKKIEDGFTNTNGITYGHYIEKNPKTELKIISLLGLKDAPDFLLKKQWTQFKNDIYQESQKPVASQEDDKTKLVPTLTESITKPDLYNTYISEVKIYLKENDKLTEVASSLDSKTYVYLNGKIIVVMITIEGKQAYNENNVQWVKTISEATAEKLIELNPPTEAEIKAEQQASSSSAIKLIIGIFAALLYYFVKFFRRSKKENAKPG